MTQDQLAGVQRRIAEQINGAVWKFVDPTEPIYEIGHGAVAIGITQFKPEHDPDGLDPDLYLSFRTIERLETAWRALIYGDREPPEAALASMAAFRERDGRIVQ